jgi:hypothetical protein
MTTIAPVKNAYPDISVLMSTKVEFQRVLNEMLREMGLKRDGVLAKVSWDTVKPAPAMAWYTPGEADITFHVGEFLRLHPDLDVSDLAKAILDGDSWVRYSGRSMTAGGTKAHNKIRREVLGVLIHEAAHARWSTWAGTKFRTTLPIIHTLTIFEEGRVEKRAIDERNPHFPKFRTKEYLRAVGRLLFDELSKADMVSVGQALQAWALIKGRANAGTLSALEFSPIDNVMRSHFGDDLIDDLTDIYDEAMSVDANHDFERLVELAKEWNETAGITSEDTEGDEGGCSHHVKEKAKGEVGTKGKTEDADKEDGEEGEGGGDGDGDGGEGESDAPGKPTDGESSDGESDESEFVDADETPLIEVEGDSSSATADGIPAFRKAVTKLVEEVDWERVEIETTNPREAVSKVFEKRQSYEGAQWKVRKPTPHEVAASNKLAQHFETLTVPTITSARVLSEQPTGRLKSREAVRRSAERAQGRMSTAKPWIDKKRKHGLGAPVIVGIATDTSGSMSWAQSMVATAAYIVGKAGHRIHAKTAAVTFGTFVESVLNPDEIPTEVRERQANGGVEEFDIAMAALDGALGLTTAPGAKVLIVISDNELVNAFEPEKRAAWMERMHKAGVAIIWVDQADHAIPNVEAIRIDRHHHNAESLPMELVRVISKAVDKAFASKRGSGWGS